MSLTVCGLKLDTSRYVTSDWREGGLCSASVTAELAVVLGMCRLLLTCISHAKHCTYHRRCANGMSVMTLSKG